MSVNVTINGTTYSFPTTGDENWGTIVSNWASAVSQHLLQKTGGSFTLSSEVNFGATYGLKTPYYKSQATNPSSSGIVRLGNNETVSWRNQGNTSDLPLKVNTSNKLEFNTDELVSLIATQTITNKIIDADNNTISNLEVDNLKSGVLDTDLISVSGSHDTLPSALAVKTYVDNSVAGVNEASEISFDNSSSGLIATNVQTAIDEVDVDVDDLNTLSGVAKNAQSLGVFSGSTISDSRTIKQALQDLENAHEEVDTNVNDLITLSGVAENATSLGTFSGSTISDNTTVKSAFQEIETSLETKASSSSLSSHTSATSAHGVSGNIVGTSDIQTLSNKTLTAPIVNGGNVNDSDINLGTASNSKKLVVSKDTFANINSLTKEEASVYYATDAKKLYYDDGTSLLEVGSGSGGGINYVSNSGFEVNADGWSTFADGAVALDMTGGSPNTTFSRNTSSPLRDTADGLITKNSGSSRLGEGVSYPFTIDAADQGKMLEISFDYKVSSTYTDGLMRVQVYDVTNGVNIEPSQRDILANSGQASYKGYFQAASNSTSYRVGIVVASAETALSYTINIDNVKVGPIQSGNAGTFVSDWVKYTSPVTQGFGTISSDDIYWRRNGSSLEMFGRFTAGTVTATQARITYPNSLIPNSTVFGQTQVVGRWWRNTGAGSNRKTSSLVADTNGYLRFTNDDYTTAVAPTTSLNGDACVNTSDVVLFHTISIPIQGWSTGVSATSIPSNSISAFRMAKTSNQTVSSTSATKVTFNSLGAANAGVEYGSGASTTDSRFTAPESGLYWLSTTLDTFATDAGTGVVAYIYKNGSIFVRNDTVPGSVGSNQTIVQCVVDAVKGDYFEVYVQSKGGDASYSVGGNPGFDEQSVFQGFKIIQSPAIIAPTEFVGCAYTTDAGQAITTAGGPKVVLFEDKVFDSHNAYNTSTGIYTVPISGTYKVEQFNVFANSTAWNIVEEADTFIAVNGTYITEATYMLPATSASSINVTAGPSHALVNVNKGDTISLNVYQNSNATINLRAAGTYNRMAIFKVS